MLWKPLSLHPLGLLDPRLCWTSLENIPVAPAAEAPRPGTCQGARHCPVQEMKPLETAGRK